MPSHGILLSVCVQICLNIQGHQSLGLGPSPNPAGPHLNLRTSAKMVPSFQKWSPSQVPGVQTSTYLLWRIRFCPLQHTVCHPITRGVSEAPLRPAKWPRHAASGLTELTAHDQNMWPKLQEAGQVTTLGGHSLECCPPSRTRKREAGKEGAAASAPSPSLVPWHLDKPTEEPMTSGVCVNGA